MTPETLPAQDSLAVSSERGRHLGAAYLARRTCGKVSAMCWDDPGSEKDTAKQVAGYIKRGDRVERVERYEFDPMPEWICRSGCTDCSPLGIEGSRITVGEAHAAAGVER